MKYYIITSIALIIAIFAKWKFDSNDYGETLIFSKDRKPIEKIIKDELFDTEIKQIEWQDGFWLGLLPGIDKISLDIIKGAIPLSSIIIAINGIALYIRKKRKK